MESNVIQEAQEPVEPEIDIIISNVVSTFLTGCFIDLRTLAMRGINVTHLKDKGMVSMVLTNPKVTASIWNKGKIACTGCRSIDEAYYSSRYVAKLLKNLGFRISMHKFKVVNILAVCTMPFKIDVISLARAYPKHISYEPEMHPGATYAIPAIGASLKIFTTGKITITAADTEIIQKAVEDVYDKVLRHVQH